MQDRETLSSRLGFILLAAGCAIGLGNIWRFPFIVGKYGGAVFVLMYLIFLIILGLPMMSLELAVGRGSKRTLYGAAKVLPRDKRLPWKLFAGIFFSGSAVLMSYYTTVTGWLLAFFGNYVTGDILGPEVTGGTVFNDLLASPGWSCFYMLLVVLLGSLMCYGGLRKGVERSTKLMMAGLLILLVALAIRAVTLSNAAEGISFYLKPDWSKLSLEAVCAALGQAFFTLSIGVGSIAIFGSYIGPENSLLKESAIIIVLDTMVAILAGFMIFPACSSQGVEVNSGPGLIFMSLPEVFAGMAGERYWGLAFFFLMSMAAMTTVVAVFENLIAFMIDEWHFSRTKATLINGLTLAVLSLPCALGYNLLSWIKPLGGNSTILDLEDHIVSNILLPLGSVFIVILCTSARGWGWENALKEVNTGKGWKMPKLLYYYIKYIIPLIIVGLFVMGYL